LANANGIASMTYGKSTAGGPAGWEIARRHPDWFKQDAAGRIIGTYNTDIFARWDSLPQFAGRDWYYLYPDLTNPVALDHGIDEILNSSVEYGWDGVRFDGDFTWVGSGEVAAFNQRRMKERIWAKLPNYVFGFNEGYGPPETDPATWPHSLRETLAGGGHWMNEGIRHYGYATNGVYASYQEYWQGMNRDANQLRQLGASYHLIYDAPRDLRGTYKVVLGTAAGAHPCYGDTAWIPGCANWGRYLTRWSAFVWDVNLRNRPDTDVEITAQSPLWHVIKERVADTKTTTTVVQLIVPPSTLDVKDEKVQVGPTAGPVMVRVRIPAGETVTRAAALAPEHPDEALALPVTRQGAWAVVTVPEVKLWTMVVFERAGAFTVPAYPKFTEPPDPAKVAEGRKTTGKLIRDPLRPDLPNPEAGAKVQVLEMEHIYQTCAKVEKDRDASGGACVRVDHTMSNSTVISHAVYRNVFPGHFRATYRMKLKSTTGDDGKPIWAGFGLYVYLGTKQLWLKEVEPKDFKTPGQYEDFTIEFDFLGEGSTITPSAFWRGQQAGGTIYVDKITLEQLSTYNDAQIAEKLKYVERIVQTPGGAPGLDVLVVNGLYHDKYRLPAALLQFGDVLDRTPQPAAAPAAPDAPKDAPLPAGDVYVTYATVDVTENDATLSGYPKTYEELCAYDVVVLVNADAAWFGFPGRAALRDYVKAGGGLLVLGGSATLGQGAFANTFLDEMLPVTVAAGRDIASTGKPLPLKPAATGLARALPAEVWQTPAYLYWRHLVRPKPEAQVHLSAGDAPVLFTGTYGQGRVAAFTGTVLGEPAGKEGPFWQWKGWPLLMHNALRWLAQMPAGK
ncbi:MAG TPA: glutamine amidotransferase, partial [Armatimonadota bacterium]|nr:glutamine amidotransferase [Armatimonadota bacterium]